VTTVDYVLAGSLTIDNILTADGRAVPRLCGGNAVYAAIGARIWSDRVGILTRVGRDYPTACLERLAVSGVDLAGVAALDEPHGMNVAFCYRSDGSRTRAFPEEAFAQIPAADRPSFRDYTTLGTAHRFATWMRFTPEPGDLPAAWDGGVRGMHLAAMPVERHVALARAARRRWAGVRLTLDSPWYDERDLGADHHTALLPLLDAILPSEADLAIAMAGLPPVEAARRLIDRGARAAVVKLGAAGCVVLGPGRTGAWRVPAYPAVAVDPTGAGDAFCGGFLVGLVQTHDPVEAAAYGTVSASFVVEAVEAFHGLGVRREQAEGRLGRVRSAIRPLEVRG